MATPVWSWSSAQMRGEASCGTTPCSGMVRTALLLARDRRRQHRQHEWRFRNIGSWFRGCGASQRREPEPRGAVLAASTTYIGNSISGNALGEVAGFGHNGGQNLCGVVACPALCSKQPASSCHVPRCLPGACTLPSSAGWHTLMLSSVCSRCGGGTMRRTGDGRAVVEGPRGRGCRHYVAATSAHDDHNGPGPAEPATRPRRASSAGAFIQHASAP